MPRVILAPIFGMWFGLGIWSKVALAVTLVFFIVFFNVYQGVREVSPTLLDNARMLGARRRQLLRHVYLPSATSWVFSSLHTSVGLAFVGAVVGEYLGSASGVGYLILQAEGTFDVNTVFAGIVVLTAFALALDYMVGLSEAPDEVAAQVGRNRKDLNGARPWRASPTQTCPIPRPSRWSSASSPSAAACCICTRCCCTTRRWPAAGSTT